MPLIASTGPFTQPLRLSDWLKHEYSIDYCRRSGVLLAGDGAVRSVVSGEVLGEVPTGSATVTITAKADNTAGIGVIAAATADAKAMRGQWQIVILEPAADAGRFEVRNPKNKVVGAGDVGTAFDGGINFTWADGATDVKPGDAFYIEVDYAAATAFVALDLAGTDGSQNAVAIAIHAAEAPDGADGSILVLDGGPSIVEVANLTWPDGITAAQKQKALDQLRLLGIRAAP